MCTFRSRFIDDPRIGHLSQLRGVRVFSNKMTALTEPACRYVSPRHRAQRTLELLEIGCKERLPWLQSRKPENEEPIRTNANVEITDAIREWDYGDYEGLTSKQIRELREKNGEGPWDIWRDGCPGGE